MKKARPRVLIYAPVKAKAEVIVRGVAAIEAPRLEYDVVLESDQAERQLHACVYDAVVLGLEDPSESPALAACVPDGVPLVLVGGGPADARANGVHRVPVPLSFTLLRRTLLRALRLPGEIEDAGDLRHQAG